MLHCSMMLDYEVTDEKIERPKKLRNYSEQSFTNNLIDLFGHKENLWLLL